MPQYLCVAKTMYLIFIINGPKAMVLEGNPCVDGRTTERLVSITRLLLSQYADQIVLVCRYQTNLYLSPLVIKMYIKVCNYNLAEQRFILYLSKYKLKTKLVEQLRS